MKIGLFTDTHYCGLETLEQNRKPRHAYKNLKAAYDDFVKNKVELVVCLGDLINYDDGIETSKQYLVKISSLINSYNIPFVCCMGNHDSEVLNHDDFEKISSLRAAPLVDEYDDIKLIFLDANYTLDGKPFVQEDVDWTCSFVPKNQLDNLEKELTTNKKCIIFIHQNIDVNVEKHHIVSNADEVNSIIARHDNVKHVYQGHYHYGDEHIIGSVPYTTIRAMCIGEENNYRIIEE